MRIKKGSNFFVSVKKRDAAYPSPSSAIWLYPKVTTIEEKERIVSEALCPGCCFLMKKLAYKDPILHQLLAFYVFVNPLHPDVQFAIGCRYAEYYFETIETESTPDQTYDFKHIKYELMHRGFRFDEN